MRTKQLIFWMLALLGASNLCAQNYGDPERYLIDSLDLSQLIDRDVELLEYQLDIFHLTESDSVKVRCLETIIDNLGNEIWIEYNKFAYDFIRAKTKDPDINDLERNFFTSQMAGTINNMGFAANAEGNAFKAVDYYLYAGQIFRSIKDSVGIALTYVNAATAYNLAGEMELSNEMDFKGIDIAHDINHMKILSVGYKNISMKLFNAEDYEGALENSEASLKYAKLLPEDPVAEAVSLMGLGQIYSKIKQDSMASACFLEALAIKKDYATEASYASSLGVYAEHLKATLKRIPEGSDEYFLIKDSTETCFLITMHESERLNQTNVLIRTYKELSKFYYSFDENQKALLYADKAYALVKQTSNMSKRAKVTKMRYLVLKELGRHKEALNMLEESLIASDKVNYSDALQVTARHKAKLEYSIKAAEDSVKFNAAQQLHLKEIEHQNEQIAADNRQKWILYSGLGLIAIFSFFLYKKFRQTQSQNKMIQHQKEQIVEAHAEMRSSIEYAKRLQAAILPAIVDVHGRFGDCFILFKPKDIVSGDFYWSENAHGYDYIAAADCTGHGVPGAMVSVVCSNALHQALHEFQLTDPADILNKTRQLVIDTFAKSGENVKDGMDISLCRINKDSRELLYAGANNPLWIKRKESSEIEEIKGDKQPVGLYEGMTPFKSNQTQFQTGDMLFLFTDGYADQFGGEKGKKLKYKPFKRLLVRFSNLPAANQEQKLSEHFDSWRGEHEQIDDVCVIGIKF